MNDGGVPELRTWSRSAARGWRWAVALGVAAAAGYAGWREGTGTSWTVAVLVVANGRIVAGSDRSPP